MLQTKPTSLKQFKELLQIGQELKLVSYQSKLGTNETWQDAPHRYLNALRQITGKNSVGIQMANVNLPNPQGPAFLEWPKANTLTFLCDERGFYGFVIEDTARFNVKMVYHFA